MRVWRRSLIAAALAMLCLLIWAGWPPPRDKMVFRPVSEAPKLFRFLIGGGTTVNAALEYPAAFYAEYDQPCSGTLIGRNTILISAHCLFESGQTTVDGPWGETAANCRRHPKYQNTSEYDVALCKTEKAVQKQGFEQIVRPPFQIGTDAPLLVTGWGESAKTNLGRWLARIRFRLGLGGYFKVGRASGNAQGPLIVATGGAGQNGQVVGLEHGDSGGATYHGPTATRRIVGVNSCGGKGCGESGNNPIVLANLADQLTADFIEAFATEYNAHICGRNSSDDEGCRQ